MGEYAAALLERDQLPQMHIPAELQETVRDCYRMMALRLPGKVKTGENVMEFYSFSPAEYKRGSLLTGYEKKVAMVTYERTADDNLRESIRTAR